MAEQKAKARAAWKGSGSKASDDIWFDLAEEYGATEFTGYSGDEGEGVVLAIVIDGQRVEMPRSARRSKFCSTKRLSTARAAARSATPEN